MTRTLLALSAGNPGGSAEILLTEAVRAVDEATVEVVRLGDLDLGDGTVITDDAWWFWDRLMESDGLIVSTPIVCRTVPARLKVLIDVVLGPNADRAIVEGLLARRAAGQEPVVPFRVDPRVLEPRVAGFIAVGGSLTPQWKALALPVMHTLTFSLQTAVVDQMLVSGTGTPQSVLLDDAAIARAAQLGREVGAQLGRTFDEVEYRGDPGLCPMCHLDVITLTGRAVQCATCGATGALADDFTVTWTNLDTSVISMAEKRSHFAEIGETAQQHAKVRDLIDQRAAGYDITPWLVPVPTSTHHQEK